MTFNPSIEEPAQPSEAQLNYLDVLLNRLEQAVDRGRLPPTNYTSCEDRFLNLATKLEASILIEDIKVLLNES